MTLKVQAWMNWSCKWLNVKSNLEQPALPSCGSVGGKWWENTRFQRPFLSQNWIFPFSDVRFSFTGFNADDLDLLNFLYDDESGLVTFLMKAKQNY